MAKPPPDPAVVLGIFRDRIAGIPAAETAQKYGYKPKTLTDIAGKYGLEDLERELRLMIVGQSGDISPEAQKLNEEYETELSKIAKQIVEAARNAENLRFESDLDKMRFLDVAAKALENTRQSRLKIAGVITDAKKRKDVKAEVKEEGYKSAYEDLLEDEDNDDEGD